MNPLLPKLFTWSRSTHRLAMFGMVILGLLMGTTGSMLKFPLSTINLLGTNTLQLARYLHNQVSPFFSILLAIMMLTGIYMYWFPWYSKRQAMKQAIKKSTKSIN